MVTKQPGTFPAGRSPWDPVNGFRVGALTGGVVGVLVSIGLSVTPLGPVAVGVVAGGILGYRTEKHKQGESTRSTTMKTTFTTAQAEEIATQIGLDFAEHRFDVEQFRMGLAVELEHGLEDTRTNVTGDDTTTTGKIAWAHLNEFPDYYTRLAAMESEAHEYWDSQPKT
jgi:uncharacterized protein YcfJ